MRLRRLRFDGPALAAAPFQPPTSFFYSHALSALRLIDERVLQSCGDMRAHRPTDVAAPGEVPRVETLSGPAEARKPGLQGDVEAFGTATIRQAISAGVAAASTMSRVRSHAGVAPAGARLLYAAGRRLRIEVAEPRSAWKEVKPTLADRRRACEAAADLQRRLAVVALFAFDRALVAYGRQRLDCFLALIALATDLVARAAGLRGAIEASMLLDWDARERSGVRTGKAGIKPRVDQECRSYALQLFRQYVMAEGDKPRSNRVPKSKVRIATDIAGKILTIYGREFDSETVRTWLPKGRMLELIAKARSK